jgi:urea transport system substrate-binding protein
MPSTSYDRRRFLKTAGQAGLAVAAGGVAVSRLHSVPAPEIENKDPIKVGILHSLTGVMAISETTLKDAELLAIDEINAAGGVLGRKVEPIVEDPQSRFTDVFPEKAKKLIKNDKVAAVFGCWVSVARKNVLPVFEENDALLFFPVAFEGNECSKNVVYTGAVPNQQVLPAIEYLWDKLGKRKFYLLGSDYSYPRTVNLLAHRWLKAKYKAEAVGEKYRPLDHQDFATAVKDIVATKADVVLNSINGDSNINFFNEMAEQKLTPDKVPVCSLAITEDELRGLDAAKVNGHLAAWNYFQSVASPRNKQFVAKFHGKYGKDRAAFDPMEAAYTQVFVWKAAVEKARSLHPDKVREALRDLEVEGPGGKIKIDGKNQHAWKRFRMGKIKDGQFEIVHESKELIRPDPYPQAAFPGWDCDWTKGGRTRGNDVRIDR